MKDNEIFFFYLPHKCCFNTKMQSFFSFIFYVCTSDFLPLFFLYIYNFFPVMRDGRFFFFLRFFVFSRGFNCCFIKVGEASLDEKNYNKKHEIALIAVSLDDIVLIFAIICYFCFHLVVLKQSSSFYDCFLEHLVKGRDTRSRNIFY